MIKPKNLDAVHSVCESALHPLVAERTMASWLSELGLSFQQLGVEPKLTVNYGDNGLTLHIGEFLSEDESGALYDAISGSKYAFVTDTKHITYSRSVTQVCQPQDVEIRIVLSLYYPLPAEDLATLRRLGKVTTEVIDPYIEERVSCAI